MATGDTYMTKPWGGSYNGEHSNQTMGPVGVNKPNNDVAMCLVSIATKQWGCYVYTTTPGFLAAKHKIQGISRIFWSFLRVFLFHMQCLGNVFGARTKSQSHLSACNFFSTMSSFFQGLSRTTTEIQVLSSA